MKNNAFVIKFNWIYLGGFLVILALPLLALQPWFLPPDWGKTIVFRSITAILLCLFAYQFLYAKEQLNLPNIKKNKTIWLLGGVFLVFFIASIFSVDPYFSFWGSPLRSGGSVNMAFYITFAILIFLLAKKNDWTKIWNYSIIIGGLVSLIAVIQFYGLLSNIIVSITAKPASTLGNPNFLAMYVLLLFFITLSLGIKKYLGTIGTKARVKASAWYAFALLLFLYIIVITGSRAVYLGLLIGSIFFVLFYPVRNTKKFNALKIIFAGFLVLMVLLVWYTNVNPKVPNVLSQNKIFQAVYPRLSISLFLNDARFSAWQIALRALKEKPLLGWGPENFSVGFDKHYDPSLPYMNDITSNWWDKAHNILLDIGVQTGILGIIIYLALFGIIFWQLQKTKQKEALLANVIENLPLMAHGAQATLAAYLVANMFSFDSFSSYLLFFLLVGYALHLTLPNFNINENPPSVENTSQKTFFKKSALAVLFILLIVFLWQYNFVPLQINSKINISGNLAYKINCSKVFSNMDSILPRHSLLDSYVRLQYMYFTEGCANAYPGKNTAYAPRIVEILKEATTIQPLFTRFWIYLGQFTNEEASLQQDPNKKAEFLKEATSYLQKANQLAPAHQEIMVEQAKTYMLAGDYNSMKNEAQKCVNIYQNYGDCYWFLGLSEIYSKNYVQAQKDIDMASQKSFDTHSFSALYDLADAYSAVSDYKNLSQVYEQLILLNPKVPQYHSSLALIYQKIGEYKKAREQALIVLKLTPELKDQVDAFLKTLPY